VSAQNGAPRADYLAFALDEARFMVAAREVLAVIDQRLLQAAPELPDWTLGLVSLGRESVPVLDFCAHVQLGQAAPHSPSRGRAVVIVVNTGASGAPLLGLPADSASHLPELPGPLEVLPALLRRVASIRQVIEHPDGYSLLVEPQLLLPPAQHAELVRALARRELLTRIQPHAEIERVG
jgi:chemotaxis signal transduction protein